MNNTGKRLKNYIISCHVDKPLTQAPPESIFDCPIQAGTALTDMRICAINDMDDCPGNISDRNKRYSEATAMYWIGKHIDTDYIGIMHYRRRLNLTDEQITDLMDNNVDIISTVLYDLGESIEENYRRVLYSCDWDLLMEILKKRDRDNYEFYCECLSKPLIHVCNVNIFRADLYRELCDWAFPICDDFFRLSPEKTDVYQHRDVAFIMERLSHLFVMRKQRDGSKVAEAELVDIRSKDWEPENACDFTDLDEVFNTCDRLYKVNQIIRCNNVLGVALRNGGDKDERLRTLSEILIASILERMELPVTMHEYLPEEFRGSLEILIEIWNGFKTIASLNYETRSEESLNKLTQYIKLTNFSKIALREAINASKRDG